MKGPLRRAFLFAPSESASVCRAAPYMPCTRPTRRLSDGHNTNPAQEPVAGYRRNFHIRGRAAGARLESQRRAADQAGSAGEPDRRLCIHRHAIRQPVDQGAECQHELPAVFGAGRRCAVRALRRRRALQHPHHGPEDRRDPAALRLLVLAGGRRLQEQEHGHLLWPRPGGRSDRGGRRRAPEFHADIPGRESVGRQCDKDRAGAARSAAQCRQERHTVIQRRGWQGRIGCDHAGRPGRVHALDHLQPAIRRVGLGRPAG